MSDILSQIATARQIAVDQLKSGLPLDRFARKLNELPGPRFAHALAEADRVNIIAEIKKGSPSQGVMVADFQPEVLAKQYARGGAVALSVLTEEEHFFGKTEYMAVARAATGLPILCKDFIVDPYQLPFAKYHGADAVLLIAALHSTSVLRNFIQQAGAVGLDCLVEAHNERELDSALEAGAAIVGVNNRNLADFTVSLETSERLAARLPDSVTRVSESGIVTREDIVRLQNCGYNCFLIGGALVKADDPTALLNSLRSV